MTEHEPRCGTLPGLSAHRARGEDPCPACRLALEEIPQGSVDNPFRTRQQARQHTRTSSSRRRKK